MRLTLTEFITLDGVHQGPGSPDEDTSGGFTRGGWMVPHMDEAFITRAAGWLARADALLLGRRTYEAFAQAWPRITDADDPFTERMNGLPKYVVSRSLVDATWEPAEVLRGDLSAEVLRLKAEDGEELQVHGSGRLAQSLLATGLVERDAPRHQSDRPRTGAAAVRAGRAPARDARHRPGDDSGRPCDPGARIRHRSAFRRVRRRGIGPGSPRVKHGPSGQRRTISPSAVAMPQAWMPGPVPGA